MRRTLLTIALSLAVAAPHAGAQVPAVHSTEFGSLASLAGSCWIGTFPDGKQTDEHCFEWMLDRKFIRDRHVVRGGTAYAGETIYRWDPAAKQLSFHYWNSEGQLMTGTGTPTEHGLDFLTSIPSPKGDVTLKATWTLAGTDGYRVWNAQRAGDEWKELWTMEMKRTGTR